MNENLIVFHAEIKNLHEQMTVLMHKPDKPDLDYLSITRKLCEIELELKKGLE